MAEIPLDRAIVSLSSDKQRERSDGLADLKRILQQNKHSSKLTSLSDKACYKIFDSLFRFIAVEKSSYLRALKSNSRGPSGSRLSACASVIRTAVDVFWRNLRTKSVRAIIDHITDTLPTPGEALWEPLSVDYAKSLAALLRYPPHVEHLGDDDWEQLMTFCLRSLGLQEDEDSQHSRRNGRRSTLDDYVDAGSGRSTPLTPSLTIRERPVGDKSVIEEVLICIQLLTASSNAPVQGFAEKILRGLAEFVKSTPIAGSAHQAAFNSINTVVTKVLFDQSALVRVFLLDLIPVIRRLWATKHIGLKDELLVTISLCIIFLGDSARREPSEFLADLVEGLMNTLYSEYTKRPEKEILQLDELTFCQGDLTQLAKPIIRPRLGNAKSEHNWTVIWAMASLLQLAEDITLRLSAPQTQHEVPNKRQRLTSATDDILRDSFSSSGLKKLCALQLVPFVIRGCIDLDSKSLLLERLIPNINDDNASVSSWTMVAIASIASIPDAKSPSLKACWQRIWDVATRASTSQVTSRGACILMSAILQFDLLEYSAFAETTRSMLSSVNLNGPSTISDSSLSFWATMIRMSAQMNPGSVMNASKQLCGWLREVWTIGTVTDKIQTAQVASFARPLDLLNLLLACTNKPFSLPNHRSSGPTGHIAHNWHFLHRNRQLLRYLFQIEGMFESVNPWDAEDTFTIEQSARPDPNDTVVLDLLQAKSEMFLQAWRAISEDKSHYITVDVVQVLCSFCIVTALYAECLPRQFASRLAGLELNNQQLWQNICSFLEDCETDFNHVFLDMMSPVLASTQCFFDPSCAISRSLSKLVPPLAEVLESYRRRQNDYHSLDSEKPMDVDDLLSLHIDESSPVEPIFSLNRNALPLFYDAGTFQRCMTVQLSIFHRSVVEDDQSQLSDTAIIEYLTELDELDILSAQSYLPQVYRACSVMNRESLLRILEEFGEKCLQLYGLERCESSHCLCIRMMSSFVATWTGNERDHLSDSAADIYTWLTDVLLANQMASSRVYISLAELLDDVIRYNANYPGDQSSPSPRTCLFTILQQGDLLVKFGAANLIPRLFGRFLLKDHDVIFNDVLESLPRDPDWVEGIALRLFVLAQLASEWHTLLRKSIYHMFETPAQVPQSRRYAEECLQKVAKTLGLENPKELFRLFSSQILYTWIETQSITSMPFRIFGYASLSDLLNDVQDEIVGQVIMRGKESETVELSNCVNTPFVQLLDSSFYEAEAYSIARDISTPPGEGSQPKGAENQLKRILGTEKFVSLIEQQFPLVIATFFRSLDQYDQIERAFVKRSNFQDSLAVLRNITGKSASTMALPANQQPSFRARYLLDELEFLCKRAGYELGTIWTPTLVSFVCRTLLESIHPALGSLHACSVIRKIRILVSVAGQVMLRDYPFEMILHALRPFLTDVYCSEDALGIFWYLLEAGALYLTENPAFMAGITVSTFLSLRNFSETSSGDAAQDSQLKAAVPNTKGFLSWFKEFLETYTSPFLGSEVEPSFRRLVKAAQKVSTAEDASKEAIERDLLVEVLRDRNSAQSLLSRPISDQVVSLLCSSFKRPLDTSSILSGEDESNVSHTVAIFQTLENFNPGTDYRLWAAKVMGRAFASTGNISDVLLREQDPSLFDDHSTSSSSGVFYHSKVNILKMLCGMLQNDSHLEVGLVEHTLQLTVSKLIHLPEFEYCESAIPPSLMNALIWNPYHCPVAGISAPETRSYETLRWDPSVSSGDWARNIALYLSAAASEDPVIGTLSKILSAVPGLAECLLPYILHDVLLAEVQEGEDVRQAISSIFKQALQNVDENTIPHARLVINCILYLRNQPRPDETTIVGRDSWLDIDYSQASSAANKCRMPKTSFLFLEIHASQMAVGSRRSSAARYSPPSDMLHDVFKNIDDPDLFYGVQRDSSLNSVMERLEYESSGFKNLLFQSAQYDSEIQLSRDASMYGVVKALNSTNLQGIANSMFSAPSDSKDTSGAFDSMLQAATSLRQWDIPVSPMNHSPSATVFRAFQSLNTSGTLSEISTSIDECLLTTLNSLTSTSRSATFLRTAMKNLGIMTEINDVLCTTSLGDIEQEWQKIKDRNFWLKTASFHEVGEIINWQEALFSSIKRKEYLKSAIGLSDSDAQLLEVKVIRQSLDIARSHEIPQASLKSAICLSKLADACSSLGINVEGAAKFDLANVLWDQGEMTTSIGMLQQLNDQNDLYKQAIPISRAELLVTLGHHVAEARLEKPEAIVQEYLSPAVKELKGSSEGDEAGRVYHGFAMFCDQQLQNPDGLEDFRRAEQLRDRKENEVRALEEMLQNAQGKERDALRMHRAKAKQWFDLDDREYQRLRRSREAFLQQCLENYLLCLKESDTYNNDALRFCAIWLDKSDSDIANTAVSKHVNQVPSRKFATLMNQLSSRLLDVPDHFQTLLFALIFRICAEHPFHGMYQIFASSKSKGGKDQASLARHRAAGKLVEQLKNDKRIGPTWVAVHNTNISYVRFAVDRPNERLKSGSKVPLRKLPTGQRLEQDAATQRLPPPTMKIELRADCDYDDVPKLTRFSSEFTVASGVSAPKIVTAVASDGKRYKQLFKGGNDDLRQDAIMEQVFEQVSSLLKDHQATRQRNLGIRTYKVLPLTSNAGIIEFVPNTIPLHDFLMPAHQKYFPKDMPPNVCRKHISDVQTRSFEQRVRTYRQVTEHFRPVMRYFFMEKYNNPDDWFSKRLSYTRSTAAISILGHVLGLGDRHGHNILLDERTGEVVHIDLGVAFEQGRVLPVPEVVPFRLTRDLVDGMGITKTEGVFRRCCEFTLEALRQESYSIMTILDVLRYDPLYSWTVSPLRMRKMQDPQVAGDAPVLPGATDKHNANEPSEADRALTVVAKKLSKTLSVTATVNELIQQATDERNLAVLYCGWASYA